MQFVRFFLLISLTLLSEYSFTQTGVSGQYRIRLDKPRQVIWGLGVEIQSDAIGSGNAGLPDKIVAIPANLVVSERRRLYKELLKGFRYCRLAMGLYLRGLDASGSRIKARYPNQLKDIKELISHSGIEGVSMEYWSPAPAWKSTGSYLGGTLRDSSEAFLSAFRAALCDDIDYLKAHGIRISMWGLQNEPTLGEVGNLSLGTKPQSYSHCHYTPHLYLKAFRSIAPWIRKSVPHCLITVDSWNGNSGEIGRLIQKDSTLLKYVDVWVYHRVGSNSAQIRRESNMYRSNTFGKPVYQNEFEYQRPSNDSLCINTAQNIMNWFTFADSPTWFWLHALKPTYNTESSGYSLGFWRPDDDDDFTHSEHIRKGYWDYNRQNFNAIAGFLKYMPWNSQRFTVDEDVVRDDQRILAYKSPKGKLVVVLTNRSSHPFTFQVSTGTKANFNGYRYTPQVRNMKLGRVASNRLNVTLPPWSIEFWVQQ